MIQKISRRTDVSPYNIGDPVPFYLDKFNIPIIIRVNDEGQIQCQFEPSKEFSDSEIIEEVTRILQEVEQDAVI